MSRNLKPRFQLGNFHEQRLRIYLTSENDPNVHESYLQPGDSVRFRAVPSKDEQVGVRLWFHGKDEFLWVVPR